MPNLPIKSADRVLDVLELLCRRGNAATHAELSQALGIPKSSLTGLAGNLVARGYLEKCPDSIYRLGPMFFSLLRNGKQVRDVSKIARPQLVWLKKKTREAAAFYLFRGDCVERVDGEEADYPLSYRMTPHVTFPLYSAAAGKAVLNVLQADEQAAYFEQVGLEPKTAQTAGSVNELRKRLRAIGPDKVAISLGEHTDGVNALAIPVLRDDGYPIGALSVVVPQVRYSAQLAELCRASLVTAAGRIEHELRS
jgi:DNA-binding IclR family transcriptional regulator